MQEQPAAFSDSDLSLWIAVLYARSGVGIDHQLDYRRSGRGFSAR